MTNQANAQKVMRAIIDPYKRVYGDMHPDLVDDLIEDLGSYSEEILASGWKEVRRTRKSKPTIAHIIEACEKAAEKRIKGKTEGISLPWIEADQKAETLLNAYLKTILNHATFKAAESGGYDVELYNYIKAVAGYQAQKIAGVSNPEINWFDVFGWGRSSGSNLVAQKEKAQFLAKQQEQISTGQVGVSVPLELIRKWEQQHQGETPFMQRKFEPGSVGEACQRLIALRKAGKIIPDEPQGRRPYAE